MIGCYDLAGGLFPAGQRFRLPEEGQYYFGKILAVLHGDTRPDFFQQGPFIPEILHGRSIEDHLPPRCRFQNILPPPGHQRAAAITDRCQAVAHEQAAELT